jgi:thioredoxin reductase
MIDRADMVIIGAGAAELMAGIGAGRSQPQRSIVIIVFFTKSKFRFEARQTRYS